LTTAFVVFPTRNFIQPGLGGGFSFVTRRHTRTSARTATREATAETTVTNAVQASFFMALHLCSQRAGTVAKIPFGSDRAP
jgi:hypothetical protein